MQSDSPLTLILILALSRLIRTGKGGLKTDIVVEGGISENGW